MQMGYTISTHNGSSVARNHNIRDSRIVSKEKHIKPGGDHETWKDETERDAYNRLFGSSLEEYNNKQKRADRRIEDYYQHIKNDNKKHTCYEMIIQVGNLDNKPNDDICKFIYRQYFEQWKTRNPNMELIGAYYHNDEQGGCHLHLDYIPIYHSSKRGLSIQTGLEKALNEQGFVSDSIKATAQMKWIASENKALEDICIRYGLDIVHPGAENAKHLDTREYKQLQKIESLKVQSDKWEELMDMQKESVEYFENLIKSKKNELSKLQNQLNQNEQQLLLLQTEIGDLIRQKEDVEACCMESLERWDSLRNDILDDIISQKELNERIEKNSELDEEFLSSVKTRSNDWDMEL